MTNESAQTARDAPPQGLLRLIDEVARIVGAALIAVFTVIVIYVVFSRYVLSTTPRWAEELPRLLLVWVTFIGAISAFARRSHFSAGLMQLVIPEGRVRRATLAVSTVATAIFLIVLAVTGWKIASLTWSNQTTALSMPVGLFYAVLPATCMVSVAALILAEWRK